MGERTEILFRIPIAIVSGIILGLWRYFIMLITIFNWFYTLIVRKRLKEVAELGEIWNTQVYIYLRYLTLVSNKRPFPFRSLTKSLSKFEKK